MGVDVECIKKYGMIYEGTMIIDGTKFVKELSPKIIREEIKAAFFCLLL